MPRISLYSPSIASAVLPQGYTARDASLFGEGRSLPSGGASTSTMAGGQKGVFGADGGGAMGTIAGMLGGSGLRSVFFGAPEDPRAAQARAMADAATAEAEERRGKEARAAGGANAQSQMGRELAELDYRMGRGGQGTPSPILSALMEAPPSEYDVRGEPGGTEASRQIAAASRIFQTAVANGADEKSARALMSAFALGTGSDNEIVRVNSALDDKYLGKGESPSLAAQRDMIEDEQRQELTKQEMIERSRIYGFDKEAETSRANNTDDNATSRANNAATNATSVRTNNADNTSAERRLRYEKIFDATLGNAPVQTTETKFNADGTVDKKQVRTQRQPVPSSAPARAAPARGAAQPPKRIKFDAQGNPIP